MKVYLIDLTKPNIEIKLSRMVIEISTIGVQGPAGPSTPIVTAEAYSNLTVTNQTYLICKGDNDLIITLKNTAVATPITIVNATNGKTVTVQCSDGQTILGHSGWNIVSPNVFEFVPQGDQYYVA